MLFKKTIQIPIYDNNRLCIVVTDDDKQLSKSTGLNVQGFESILGCVVNYKDRRNRTTVFLILNPNDDAFNLGVIVHESVHAANRVFQNIYHRVDTDNDEPSAYLTEWIFNQAMNFLEKCKDECNKETTGS